MLALAALSWLLTPGTAAGQDIPLRAGEHGAFTRIVLYLGTQASWELGRIPGGYGLWIDLPPGARLDTSRVFERIPRTRLARLSQLTQATGEGGADADAPGAGLALALACGPCHARGFEQAGGLLVIDIADGPAPDPRFEGPSRLVAPPPHRAAPPTAPTPAPSPRPGTPATSAGPTGADAGAGGADG
ncbi:MAG: hypothetical protein JJU40_01080, partial [Rhodobacteraceae bacterium]|nr:hypothetical protein [Paracoccaceae bacterium]